MTTRRSAGAGRAEKVIVVMGSDVDVFASLAAADAYLEPLDVENDEVAGGGSSSIPYTDRLFAVSCDIGTTPPPSGRSGGVAGLGEPLRRIAERQS